MKLALRLLARRPGFAAVAIATLALGIGAPTAIFSVVRAVLLRPLPYHEPDRVLRFGIEGQSPAGPVAFDAIPVEAALEWAAGTATLEGIGLFDDRAMTLTIPDGPFRLNGIVATPNLFELLGAKPETGRVFDAGSRDARQIVLSHAAWQRHFQARASIVGSSITLDGAQYFVTGVMAEEFRFPTSEAAFWVPVQLESGAGRGMLLPAIARMRPGITMDAVLQEGRRLIEGTGDARIRHRLVASTLQDQMVGNVRRVLWVLMAAVTIVFLLATVNIALLLLTRGAGRQREFSIRLALGAGRGRLLRQLFMEGITLAAAGGAAGLLLAEATLGALLRFAPPHMPRLQEAALDGHAMAFTVVATLVTSLLFGILSAGRTIAVDPIRALAGGAGESRLVPAGAPSRRLNLLAACELALTLVLLVGAGLLLRSFVALVLVDQGFDSRGAVALQVSLPASRYPSPAARMAFHERLLERLKQQRDVACAGIITTMPNRRPSGRFGYNPNGVQKFDDPFSRQIAEVRMASEGFLEAMGIPLLAGRTFRAQDGPGAEAVMVISRRLARLHFPDRDPIGQMLYSEMGDRRVIGVVGDVRPAEPGPVPAPAAYLPIRQSTDILQWFSGMSVVVRGSDPPGIMASMRKLVLSLDPDMPPYNVRSLDDEVSSLVAAPRFSAGVLAAFAVVALAMAAIGVYGVMAYAAGQRTREVGIRVALGATRGQIFRLMIRDGVLVVASGLGAGLIAALWLAQGLTALLHEVTPADPVSLASVAVLLSLVGLLAAYIPARRAARISVVTALREE
jgi:putative ABC transport system permease protein